ncbi:MAG: hypothetical protein ACC661_03815, partial [Verrucomicrobiales bacterium]
MKPSRAFCCHGVDFRPPLAAMILAALLYGALAFTIVMDSPGQTAARAASDQRSQQQVSVEVDRAMRICRERNSAGRYRLLAPPTIEVVDGDGGDVRVALHNPNPRGVSRIHYSFASGPWIPYFGAPLRLVPGAPLRVYCESSRERW